MEFKKVTLEDICLKITDGAHYSPKATAEGYPMYSVKDMKYNNFDNISSKLISEKDYQKLVKQGCRPEKNDVVIAKDGSYLKHVFVISDDIEAAILSSIAILKLNLDLVNPYYLSYFLKQKSVKEHMKNGYVSGSVLPRIILKDFKKYPISLPHLKIQNKVVEILKKIDSKIDNNQRIIANLEELSQTLFKRWFVDFEFPDEDGNPYKSSGGEMFNSELGEIPKAWRVETLEKLGLIVGGGTPSKKNKEYYTNNGIPWITPKDLSKNRNIYISHGENDISELGLNKSSAKLLEKNSVLFSSRAPIGYIAINNIPVTTNQGFKSIVPNEEMNPYFIYFILKNITPLIEQTASGSTFKEISAKGMKSIKIVFPSIELIKQYGNIVKKYFEEINFLENQNIKLIELRDTLLPKLMSGELEISDDIEVNSDEFSI